MIENNSHSFIEAQQFLDDTNIFTLQDKRRHSVLRETALTKGSMRRSTRLTVTIPIFYTESGFSQALNLYEGQRTKDDFELTVLLNGPHDFSLQTTPAFQAIQKFQETHTHIPVNILKISYGDFIPSSAVSIGTIRRDIATITLHRALEEHIDLDELILVTHDADTRGMSQDYMQELVAAFNTPKDSDHRPAVITGDVDYPYEVLKDNHLLLIHKRFTDILETLGNEKEKKLFARNNNSAYRMSDYIRSGGFQNDRVRESDSIVSRLQSLGKPVEHNHSEKLKIITDPRRPLQTLLEGNSLSEQYKDFGTEKGFRFYDPSPHYSFHERGFHISSPHFLKNVNTMLQHVYTGRLKKYTDGGKTLQELMHTAAEALGITLIIHEGEVIIDSIENMQLFSLPDVNTHTYSD